MNTQHLSTRPNAIHRRAHAGFIGATAALTIAWAAAGIFAPAHAGGAIDVQPTVAAVWTSDRPTGRFLQQHEPVHSARIAS